MTIYDILLAGSSDVIGLTKAETQSFLEITVTTHTNGRNIAIDGNNALNLDTDLTSVNPTTSVANTDLKLASTGAGDVLLKANPNLSGTGKIKLGRIESDSVRFNTI